MENHKNKHIEELWTVANDYCLFLEGFRDYPAIEVTEYLCKVVPMLYLKGSLLPVVDYDDDFIPERYVSEEHYQNIYMGALNKFREYPDATWDSAKSGPEFLAESLADIYQDMKDFTVQLQKPLSAEKQNAVAECGATFKGHWGLRLAELMPVLHLLLAPADVEEFDLSDLE